VQPRSRCTCAARVGLGFPEAFALGAASGAPVAAMSARATGCAGMRTATVGWPAVMIGGTRDGSAGKRRVSGPGQNVRIRVS